MGDRLEELIASLPDHVLVEKGHRLSRTKKHSYFELSRGRKKMWYAAMKNHLGQDFPFLGCRSETPEGAVKILLDEIAKHNAIAVDNSVDNL